MDYESTHIIDGEEWEVIAHTNSVAFQAYRRPDSLPTYDSQYYDQQLYRPRMSFTQEQFKTFTNAELDRRRTLGLGWALNGIPMNEEHQAFCHMSEEQKETLGERIRKDSASVGQDTASMERKPKWSWIMDGNGKYQLIEVIEDSGSDDNWISIVCIEKLNLEIKQSSPIQYTTLHGESHIVDRYVDGVWAGKGAKGGQDRFYVAPPKAPFEMLVGGGFARQHPGVFLDEKPKDSKMLLTLHAKIKKGEDALIAAARARCEAQAEELARRKRQSFRNSVALATPSTSSLGQATAKYSSAEIPTAKYEAGGESR